MPQYDSVRQILHVQFLNRRGRLSWPASSFLELDLIWTAPMGSVLACCMVSGPVVIWEWLVGYTVVHRRLCGADVFPKDTMSIRFIGTVAVWRGFRACHGQRAR